MRGSLLLLASLAAGCTLYSGDDAPPVDPGPSQYRRPSEFVDVRYDLRPAGNFAVPSRGGLVALAWDGEAFWAVTREELGGFDDVDHVEILRMSTDGLALGPPIALDDESLDINGAVWRDGVLWIHYGRVAGDDGFLRAIDLATGTETHALGLPAYLADLETSGDELFVASAWNDIQRRSPITGEITGHIPVPCFENGAVYGLALAHPPSGVTEAWVSGDNVNELAIMIDGALVAYAVMDRIPAEWHRIGVPLQFAGQRLALIADNQIVTYDVVRP